MKRPKRKHTKFYVYEHWRPDLDLPFWVGKGQGKRAYDFVRNRYHDNIVKKLARLGMCVEVRMVESGLPEHEAFALETVRIVFWRSRGIKLTNLTDGGEGASGHKNSLETIEKKRLKATGRPVSKETRKKLAAQKGWKHSVEAKAKMRGSRNVIPWNKGKKFSGTEYNPWADKPTPSKETRQKIRVTLIGRPRSKEAVAKHRATLSGLSPEQRHERAIKQWETKSELKKEEARVNMRLALAVRWADPTQHEAARQRAINNNPKHKAKVEVK